jgi:hypothetical protein
MTAGEYIELPTLAERATLVALAHKLATHPRVAGHVSRLAQEEADR